MKSYTNMPAVSIVGRPNVGKSSLFNRLLKQRKAVVVEQSGTTRDKVEAVITLAGKRVKLIDTGGYLLSDKDLISAEVKRQIIDAMDEADVILFVVDAMAGVSPADKEVAELLRKFGKSVILVVNKTDNDRLKNDAMEFYEMGFDDPVPVSSLHGRGISILKDRLSDILPETVEPKDEDSHEILRVVVVGRPNVGKSSFVNKLLNENRVIVSDIPGTTRDSIDTYFKYDGKDYLLIDTAGIRHKRKIKESVDTYSIMRSKDSIERADVVILIIDAADGFTKDDVGILRFIYDAGKACLIAVNKWDLTREIEDVNADEYEKQLVYAVSQAGKFPIMFMSAETGKNVSETLSAVEVLDSNLDVKISTPLLNKIFEKNDPENVPIPRRKRKPNFLYIVQSSHRPVGFKYFVNPPAAVLPAHLSFIENQLRENLPLKGIPIKISICGSRKERK